MHVYEWTAPAAYRLKKKIEKNKSDFEGYLNCGLDRASLIVYKSIIFPTVRFFVSEKNQFFLLKMHIFRDFLT